MVAVELTSREIIRPSSRTPPHLRKFELSLIDQMCPPVYSSIIFYYALKNSPPGNLDDMRCSSKLKHSLSETLSHFFPLAGRVRDNLYVECSDEGALFCEARVSCRLVDFLAAPNLEAVGKFLPVPTFCLEPLEEAIQVAVQVNRFSCGQIAIGLSLLHKLIDGTLMGAFVKRWASICKGCYKEEYPSMFYTKASLLFPPRSILPPHASNWLLFATGTKSCLGRYMINSDSISKLKARGSSKTVPKPTTIEALTAFIWKCCRRAETTNPTCRAKLSSSISHAVNLRPRIETALPENSIGNIVWKAYASIKNEAVNEAISEATLVKLLRQSFLEIDSHYVEKMQGDVGFSTISKWLENAGRLYADCEPSYYGFSDWCKLGSYAVDFGFGRPAWVCPGCMALGPVINGGIFVESASPGGVEVWLLLDEEEMKALEHDQEFIAFASINPTVSCHITEK